MANDMSALQAKKCSTACLHDLRLILSDQSFIFQDLVCERSLIEEELSYFREREDKIMIVSMSGWEEERKDSSEH